MLSTALLTVRKKCLYKFPGIYISTFCEHGDTSFLLPNSAERALPLYHASLGVGHAFLGLFLTPFVNTLCLLFTYLMGRLIGLITMFLSEGCALPDTLYEPVR